MACTSNLAGLQKGSAEPAYDDSTEDTEERYPNDFDLEKFNRGRLFFITNVSQCLSAMMCSLVCGLCVRNLLDVLVETGVTCKPLDSIVRYLQTTVHVLKWHYGNVWERNSSARKSIRAVRKMHNNARKLMASKSYEFREKDRAIDTVNLTQSSPDGCPDEAVKHVTQYDMSLVQCGFMGIIIMYPRKFGINCTTDDLDDYVYFWRCIGFLLGISDHNNICAGGFQQAYHICKSIEKEVLLPSFYSSPKEFYPMAAAFTDGVNMIMHFNATSPEHMFALGLDACDEPIAFKMTMRIKIQYYMSKILVSCHLYIPGFNWVMRKITELAFGCDKMT